MPPIKRTTRRRNVLLDVVALLIFGMSFPFLLGTVLMRLLAFAPTLLSLSPAAAVDAKQIECADYSIYAGERHEPLSGGRYKLPFQRPPPECRTFASAAVEAKIAEVKKVIKDPDLQRLFENTYPNTLDTAIKWHGTRNGTDEDLTFVITGDINAMWLRDSSNQLQSYYPLLKPSAEKHSIAALFRGVINLEARYLLSAPYCNAFQPPEESGIPINANGGLGSDSVSPSPDPQLVWECKYELDSLAAFLQVSTEYYTATKDGAFFGKYKWIKAVEAVMKVARDMRTPTYGPDGSVLASPYTMTRQTTRATETLSNDGGGNPVANGTGLIRSAFRPSDDATIYQLFIPANMMFARYLASAAAIMAQLPHQAKLAGDMTSLAASVRRAITDHGIVSHARHGRIYAFEVDGFGSATIMDDANIPSLLSAPLLGYVAADDPVYRNTRRMILSEANPYFMRGPKISAVGGPHAGLGMAWPMASVVRILTSSDDAEISAVLKELVGSTAGLGLIHESVNSFDETRWTRQW
jgi:meiotically up-regulated gene 157 (Mug157) protein